MSLLRQHKSFLKLSRDDFFYKVYFNLTCHYEFGPLYKPFIRNKTSHRNYLELDHWLEQWFRSYSYLFDKYKHVTNVKFICSDELNNRAYWKNLLSFIGVRFFRFNFNIPNKSSNCYLHYNHELLDKCKSLYNKMHKFSSQ